MKPVGQLFLKRPWPPAPPGASEDYGLMVVRCKDTLGHLQHEWGPPLEDENGHGWRNLCPGIKPEELPKITVIKLGRRKYK